MSAFSTPNYDCLIELKVDLQNKVADRISG
jgi:hypothetical protein